MNLGDDDPDVAYRSVWGNESPWFWGYANGDDPNACFWNLYNGNNIYGPCRYYGTSRVTANE